MYRSGDGTNKEVAALHSDRYREIDLTAKKIYFYCPHLDSDIKFTRNPIITLSLENQ